MRASQRVHSQNLSWDAGDTQRCVTAKSPKEVRAEQSCFAAEESRIKRSRSLEVGGQEGAFPDASNRLGTKVVHVSSRVECAQNPRTKTACVNYDSADWARVKKPRVQNQQREVPVSVAKRPTALCESPHAQAAMRADATCRNGQKSWCWWRSSV